MQVRYSGTQILFIKSDDKTCNMLLIVTSALTFFSPTISFLLCNLSFNSTLSRNRGVFKQHMNLTESTHDKMSCFALFLQRQYKIKLWAGWLRENLTTLYTKISCLFNEWLLLSIRSYGVGLLGWVCVCVFLMMVIL